jgi:asparagine synthase (glutamine-hydrolysing)
MEYILSNKIFTDSSEYKGIYYNGSFSVENDNLTLTEGEITKNINPAAALLTDKLNNFIGFYNILAYCPDIKKVIIRNDELGMLPLYYFHKADTFIISNNLWLVTTNISQDDLALNIPIVKSFFLFSRIPDESGTYFQNIYQLPAASKLVYYPGENKIDVTSYWSLEHKPDKRLKVSDAVDLLDNDLTSLFKYLKNKYPDRKFGFGNSGGLDSRLIPLYANENNLPVEGFITGDPKPTKVFYSTSHQSALKIAKELNFNHHNIRYKPVNFEERLFLDIRNNPLSNNQIFKNPFDKLPEFDYMFCGGNGFIVSNDSNKWKALKNVTNKDEMITYLTDYINKLKFSSRQEKILATLFKTKSKAKKYLVNSVINNEMSYFTEYFANFYEKHKHKDNISFIRSFHQIVYNRHSPSGGFESINRTKKSFYIYFPWAIANTLKWQDDFFFDRKILKELILRKSYRLGLIPDQTGKALIGETNEYYALAKTIIRGTGLDYREWYKSPAVKNATKNILQRNNPLFNGLTEGKTNLELLIKLHANIILDILKIKKILDIIYYREFDFVNNKNLRIQ